MSHLKSIFIFFVNYIKKKITIFFYGKKLFKNFKKYKEIILVSGKNIGDIYLGLDIALSSNKKNSLILSQDFTDFISPLVGLKIKENFNVIFSSKLFQLIFFSTNFKKKINKKYLEVNNTNKIENIIKSVKLNQSKKNSLGNTFLCKKDAQIKKIFRIKHKKLVFFSNRDNFFKKDKNYNSFRNSDVKNSFLALKYLKKKNYLTVRIGHYRYNKSNYYKQYKEKKILKRNLIENYVGSKCSFALVSTSGILSLPTFYDKPLLVHNFVGFNKPPIMKRAIIIPKILKYDNGDLVPIKDLFKNKFHKFEYDSLEDDYFPLKKVDIGGFQSDGMYKKAKIHCLENTELEILNGTKELEKYFIQKKPLNILHKKLDMKFKKLFPKNYWLKKSNILISFYWLKKYLNNYEEIN